MKAAVLHAANQPLTIEEVAVEKPKSREVLRIGVGFGGPVDARRGMVRLSHVAGAADAAALAADANTSTRTKSRR